MNTSNEGGEKMVLLSRGAQSEPIRKTRQVVNPPLPSPNPTRDLVPRADLHRVDDERELLKRVGTSSPSGCRDVVWTSSPPKTLAHHEVDKSQRLGRQKPCYGPFRMRRRPSRALEGTWNLPTG